MDELERMIAESERQEQELRFPEFTNRTALEIGLLLVEKARQGSLRISIDISRHGQQLFHYACEGTTPDNDQWLLRKTRVVNRFYKSSFRVGLLLQQSGKTIAERYFVDPLEYSAHGGAFPITLTSGAVIGAVAVSGLAQSEDHELVVATLREYLQKNNSPADLLPG
jgi:uncharacterized protein (UPF0303 family)